MAVRPRRKESRQTQTLAAPEGLSARPAWKGALRLSLVSCNVGLYRATTTTADVAFNLINPETGNRIKMVTTDPETGPVERSSLAKGYEVEKGKYVLFTDDELRAVKLETTDTLEIERFVDADTIDRLYWDTPYILMPADKPSVEAYSVIQQAMRDTGRIALGRLTMHTRERLVAIEPRDSGLLATTLRMKDEVVNTAEALGGVPIAKVDKQMIAIAARIIDQLEGPFDPEEFTDRYEDALHALIDEKLKGHKITRAKAPPRGDNVVDLMAALKKSLNAKAAAASKAGTPKAVLGRKPAKKKAARR